LRIFRAVDFALPDPARLRALVERYDRRAPRYTSYPPAPVWRDDFGEAEYRAALARVGGAELSVYVHVPFCERLCTFCACNRIITQDHGVAAPYLEALAREAEAIARALPRTLRGVQLALGGGSPSFLRPDELARLVAIVDGAFPRAAGAERSIELDPRNTTRAQVEVLAQHGFERVSLGVQDLSPEVQRAIHRIQSREQTETLARTARDLGVRSVNFDLIYGLPYQTVASFDGTLDSVIDVRPDRIALYAYAHVTWVAKQQRGFETKDLPSPEERIAIFRRAVERLTGAGYRFLGLDHFALPDDDLSRAADDGTLRRNFMGYTTRAGVDLVGLGPSGISELADAYAQSVREPGAWQERLAAGRLPTLRGWRMTDDDLRRKALIQRLLCQGTIDAVAADLPGLLQRLAPFEADGLVERSASGWAVTPLGRLFLRPIATALDAYFTPDDASAPRTYSRAV
jgi:oxygen-independent coproporphyrinogen-3 oxidase